MSGLRQRLVSSPTCRLVSSRDNVLSPCEVDVLSPSEHDVLSPARTTLCPRSDARRCPRLELDPRCSSPSTPEEQSRTFLDVPPRNEAECSSFERRGTNQNVPPFLDRPRNARSRNVRRPRNVAPRAPGPRSALCRSAAARVALPPCPTRRPIHGRSGGQGRPWLALPVQTYHSPEHCPGRGLERRSMGLPGLPP